jgi:hypothetical protein
MRSTSGGRALILLGLSFFVIGLAKGNAPFCGIGAIFVAIGATARRNRANRV